MIEPQLLSRKLARPFWVHAISLTLCLLLSNAAALVADDQPNSQQNASDLADKSLEELLDVKVTSVSRKEQKLSRTPAAVYVITPEAIHRSGATTIPDLLRMAPGVQVVQIDANRWAISVRGFNDEYSDKLLVLVDGRTVYTPDFSGVYWDQVDVPLDTIQQIEVVRGPGGTMWGANAVNGVISIITKNAKETQGTQLSVGAGSAQTQQYEARYGGQAWAHGYYRVFGDSTAFSSRPSSVGLDGGDEWRQGHAGFRADWNTSATDSLMVEGDGFWMHGGQTLPQNSFTGPGSSVDGVSDAGGDLLMRWTRQPSAHSQTSVQMYESGYSRTDTGLTENLSTFDLDFQNRVQLGSRNDIVWGGGYRFSDSGIHPNGGPSQVLGYAISLNPADKSFSLFSGFLQDEIRLTDRLSLTVGSKLEHNTFSGFENEPSGRLAWIVNDSQTVWLAASKAIREPSRIDTAMDIVTQNIPLAPSLLVAASLLGNPGFRAEQVRDYEAGYRFLPNDKVSVDVTGFVSFYRDLVSADLKAPLLSPLGPALLVTFPLMYGNDTRASSTGFEGAFTWNATSRWKLSATYSHLKIDTHSDANSANQAAVLGGFSGLLGGLLSPAQEQALVQGLTAQLTPSLAHSPFAPGNQFTIRSYIDLAKNWTFDTSLYFVGSLNVSPMVPAYARLDSRIAWRLRHGLEASLVGQNLQSGGHFEITTIDQLIGTKIPRSVFGKITWSF